jgi:antitoxin (DNA-binding transcriptional repressor) of toxin-antitoxin stability system
MKIVKIADLKNNLSRHLDHVRAGGDLVVLDRDTPVARVVPFTTAVPAGRAGRTRDTYWTPERLADLERRGIVSRPQAAASATLLEAIRPAKLPKGSPSVVGLLLEMRRESTR